ncbi:hypothetical protein ACIRBY_16490 [Streptomyces sp. NPDC096136]
MHTDVDGLLAVHDEHGNPLVLGADPPVWSHPRPVARLLLFR